MFTKHNNKTRSNQFKPRCHHSPLAGESQSQLVGDAKEGVNKKFHKIKYSIKSKSFRPLPKFSCRKFYPPARGG